MVHRHALPDVQLPDLRQAQEPLLPPAKPRRTKTVEFRRNKDMTQVVAEMNGFKSVNVNAATGSGKSTVLPLALAAERNLPVIHVVPARLLAVDLHDYVKKKNPNVTLALQPHDEIAKKGVTFTYSANIWALVAVKGMANVFTEFEDGVILFLDECHESDGYTYFCEHTAHLMGGVDTVIHATATPGPEGFKVAELAGTNVSEFFNPEPLSTWNPEDSGKPWSITQLDDACMIYMHEESLALNLMEKYNQSGVTAYRLTAKMDVEDYRRARHALEFHSEIVVCIADYSFRSGFTFPVSRIVDTGTVMYFDIVDGTCKVKGRIMYELEKYQTMNRGARTPGSKCTYFYPKMEYETKVCMLEGVEVELAAMLFRLVGFLPPPEVARIALSAVGNVPKNFTRAANGAVPFPCLSEYDMYPLVRDRLVETGGVQEIIDEYAFISPPNSPKDFFHGVGTTRGDRIYDPQYGAMDYLHQLQEMAGSANELVAGRYYGLPGVINQEVRSQLYGDDWKKALSELGANDALIGGLSYAQRTELIIMLLHEYNTKVAVDTAISQLLQSKDSLNKLAVRYPDYVSKWAKRLSAELRESKLMQNSLIEMLSRLRMPTTFFQVIDPNVDIEASMAANYASSLVDSIKGIDHDVKADEYLQFVSKRVSGIDAGDASSYEKLIVHGGVRHTKINVRASPRRIGHKSLWKLDFKIDNALMLQEQECQEVLEQWLTQTGNSAAAISSVRFPGADINSERVLNSVRAKGDYFRRRPVVNEYTVALKPLPDPGIVTEVG